MNHALAHAHALALAHAHAHAHAHDHAHERFTPPGPKGAVDDLPRELAPMIIRVRAATAAGEAATAARRAVPWSPPRPVCVGESGALYTPV